MRLFRKKGISCFLYGIFFLPRCIEDVLYCVGGLRGAYNFNLGGRGATKYGIFYNRIEHRIRYDFAQHFANLVPAAKE